MVFGFGQNLRTKKGVQNVLKVDLFIYKVKYLRGGKKEAYDDEESNRKKVHKKNNPKNPKDRNGLENPYDICHIDNAKTIESN